MKVQCWDLGVLRDSIHLQKLRESQQLFPVRSLAEVALAGEPGWAHGPRLENDTDAVELQVSLLHCDLSGTLLSCSWFWGWGLGVGSSAGHACVCT
jgi:hypothetical protein